MNNNNSIPATGFKGLKENWRHDLTAAVSVSLVALPLALGIAVASNVSPMSGVLSAIIGGVVTTFFRGGYLAINGPAAGLIAVILGGLVALDGNISYVLAAIVVSGGLQTILGLLKMGRFAKLLPSSVLHGILAAIGIIIIAKQAHYIFGTSSNSDNTIGTLVDAFHKLPEANPFVFLISLVGILVLVFYKKINQKFIRLIPAPMWVLLLAMPIVFGFNFRNEHSISLFGNIYMIGPSLLIDIPDSILESILHPDFAMIGTSAFWLTVISITLIASVETLASARAVDKLDPYKRVTNLNKDLVGVGLSTMVSGALGGLPIITVIVRSTVNINSNAKTKWSNLYHGILLLLFVLLLAPVLSNIPLAALAAILVHTGFKLASPKVFRDAYDQGVEQLLFLSVTLIVSLYTDLLYGIIAGIMATLLLHMLLAKVGIVRFFKMIYKSGSKVYHLDDGTYDVKLKGVSNFLYALQLDQLLKEIPKGSVVRIDLNQTRLVDLSIMENLIDFKRINDNNGGNVKLLGLENHVASTSHNRALKIVTGRIKKRITQRQIRLQKMAIANGWSFEREVDWNTSYLQNFHFFDSRPIEMKSNSLKGIDKDTNTKWEIADIVFDEGALLALEVYQTTVHVVRLPSPIPRFIIDKEGLFDKIFDRVKSLTITRTNIDFKKRTGFSNKFHLSGEDEIAIKTFFTDDLISFLEENEIHHIESNGEALMIFKYVHIARTDEVKNMLDFSHHLLQHMNLDNIS
ncbi:MAG: SulP family inorganic anion transporter [Bacteroidales bacterium]|jgi:MFS superfamily sulfate permease-like transporter|nr:SulP family inorganic anion transporter [Bacteroidales bacterium]MDG2080358.1 SulP family inorganic anion transporter [Bacteroidales bacterium]|tara:strand:+ start:3505 stop:5739 length:2235 start_codon:yes stop_codon:yes gene_type:complete